MPESQGIGFAVINDDILVARHKLVGASHTGEEGLAQGNVVIGSGDRSAGLTATNGIGLNPGVLGHVVGYSETAVIDLEIVHFVGLVVDDGIIGIGRDGSVHAIVAEGSAIDGHNGHGERHLVARHSDAGGSFAIDEVDGDNFRVVLGCCAAVGHAQGCSRQSDVEVAGITIYATDSGRAGYVLLGNRHTSIYRSCASGDNQVKRRRNRNAGAATTLVQLGITHSILITSITTRICRIVALQISIVSKISV